MQAPQEENNHLNGDGADGEDEEECRVCRGPAEEDHPLFKPCRCSGSIGLTHQDCLQSWLQVQRGHGSGSCELCKTPFRFAPQYADDTPDRLSLLEIAVALLRRSLAQWLPLLLRCMLAAAVWLCLAPLLTCYLYHGWMARPRAIAERMFSWDSIVTDLISGAIVATCIVVSFLSLMSFADFLRVEWQQRGFRGRPNNNNNNAQQRGAADLADNDNNNNNNNVNIHWRIDNGIWDHEQQQVLEQNREQNNLRARQQVAARERGWGEVFGEGDAIVRPPQLHQPLASDDDSMEEIDDMFDDDFDDEDNEEEDGEDDGSWREDDDDDDNDDDDDDDDEESDSDAEELDEAGDFVDLAAAVRGARRRQADWEGRMDGHQIAGQPQVRVNLEDEMERIMDQANEREQRNDENNNNVPPPPMPFDMDQDEPVDMDINIALDELLGLRGPLVVVVRNLLWLLAFNAVYLGFFAFVPRTIGMAVSSICFNTTMFGGPPTLAEVNATLAAIHSNSTFNFSVVNVWKAVEAESVLQNTAFRLHDVGIVLLGYFSLAMMVVWFRFMWFVGVKVRHFRSALGRRGGDNGNNNNDAEDGNIREAIDEMHRLVHGLGPNDPGPQFNDEPHGLAISLAVGVALDALMAIVKVGILLFLKMFLLPIVLGIALDASTFAVLGNTLEARTAYAGKDLFSFMLMHWVAGITFMLLVTVSVLQLREVAHPDLLAKVIRPQEPQPDLLGNLMHETVGTHAKRMVLSLFIYVCLLSLHVYFPLRFYITTSMGDALRSLLQLKFAYIVTPQLQVPLELLFFHLCMLALLEKYKNGLGGMQHQWLRFMSKVMGFSDCVLPMNVRGFRLVGARPVYQAPLKIDKFWFDMANKKNDRTALLLANLDTFKPAGFIRSFTNAETKPNGERVIAGGSDYIRLPIRLPGRALRNKAGLVPTKFGKYRLRRDPVDAAASSIQLWEEVKGDPLVRPPEGWDDLGVGGADVQGRWAWGNEKKSTIEVGVAARRPFFDRHQSWKESLIVFLKLVILGVLSWLVGTIFLSAFVMTPLVVGRTIFYLLRIPERWIHDPFGFGLGFMIIFPLARKLGSAFVASNDSLLNRFRKWVRSFSFPPTHKAAVLINAGLIWFAIVPWLVGFMYELAFVKSNDWFYGTESHGTGRSWLLKWSLGTFLMYVWADLCIWGVLTRNYRALVLEGRDVPGDENDDNAEAAGLTWQGKNGRVARFFNAWKAVITNWEWDRVDEVTLLRDCATPVLSRLFWTLAAPMLPLAVISLRYPLVAGSTRAILTRSILASACCFQLALVWKTQLGGWFEAAHKTARNDRYLIGEILMNYGE